MGEPESAADYYAGLVRIVKLAREAALRDAIEAIQRLPNSGPSVIHIRAMLDGSK